jgi:hypothetical protein
MNGDSKRSLFEWVSLIIVPAVAAIVTVLQQRPAIASSLIALGVFSLLVSSVPRIRGWLTRRRLRKQEEAIAATSLVSLKRWIHKFRQFSNTENNDTLYSIIFGKLCQSNQANFDLLFLAPPQLFNDFSRLLTERNDLGMSRVNAFRALAADFNVLVGFFCRYFSSPVYDKVPLKLSPEMLKVYTYQRLEPELVQFRERFDRFLGDYMDFLNGLDPNLLSPPLGTFAYYFDRPKPLTLLGDTHLILAGVTRRDE